MKYRREEVSEEILRLRQALSDIVAIVQSPRPRSRNAPRALASAGMRACVAALACTGGFVAARSNRGWRIIDGEDVSARERRQYSAADVLGEAVLHKTLTTSGRVCRFPDQAHTSVGIKPNTDIIPIQELITIACPRQDPELLVAVFDKRNGFSFHQQDLDFVSAIGRSVAAFSESVRLKAEAQLGARIKSFLPRALVRYVKQAHGKLQIGEFQELPNAVILFADLSGYSRHIREYGDHRMAQLLHLFRQRATAIIEERGGIVDNFVGDAILAVFGKWEWHDQYPIRAVQTAHDLIQLLTDLNTQSPSNSRDPLGIRIGIHIGKCQAGIFGERVLQHTIIGDSVNLAARIQQFARPKLGGTWISQELRNALGSSVGSRFRFERMELSGLKNIPERILVYRVRPRSDQKP